MPIGTVKKPKGLVTAWCRGIQGCDQGKTKGRRTPAVRRWGIKQPVPVPTSSTREPGPKPGAAATTRASLCTVYTCCLPDLCDSTWLNYQTQPIAGRVRLTTESHKAHCTRRPLEVC